MLNRSDDFYLRAIWCQSYRSSCTHPTLITAVDGGVGVAACRTVCLVVVADRDEPQSIQCGAE